MDPFKKAANRHPVNLKKYKIQLPSDTILSKRHTTSTEPAQPETNITP